MVSKESVEQQLKKIRFNIYGWGRAEAMELTDILMPDETIFECVNGLYEGGFALLVATNIRVLLVDKKPLNYLTVEDLRFDMITELDYSHRLLGARISIAAGSKNLKFTSYNQQRLRKLINHVQHAMADNKQKQSDHQEDQRMHLEQINQQLQAYLLAQHQQQQKLQEQIQAGMGSQQAPVDIQPLRPDPKLADYLYAQSLLAQHKHGGQQQNTNPKAVPSPLLPQPRQAGSPAATGIRRVEPSIRPPVDDLYAEGVQEVFGKRPTQQAQFAGYATMQDGQKSPRSLPSDQSQPMASQASDASISLPLMAPLHMTTSAVQHALDLSPLRIAYSRLPMAMRNRRFGRPSFHDHSQNGYDLEDGKASITDAATSVKPAPVHYQI